MTAEDEPRFWSKVDTSGECWPWTTGRFENGYGQFYLGGRNVTAHRFSYELAHGPIPKGMTVDHTCHVRHCVNPSHLRLVTQKQNCENRTGVQSNNTSGVRGVSWHKGRGKWCARVTHNRRQIVVGFFDDLSMAEAAVVEKRNELYTHNDADRS